MPSPLRLRRRALPSSPTSAAARASCCAASSASAGPSASSASTRRCGELETATRRLKLNEPGGPAEGRVTLLHGSLTYRDHRWAEADAAALVEVIEHIDPAQRPLVERVVFGEARPRTVVVTTPNADYNVLFETLPAGAMRHPDHRFEWTRAEFAAWSDAVAAAYGYAVAIEPIGDADAAHGAPSQMAVFTR